MTETVKREETGLMESKEIQRGTAERKGEENSNRNNRKQGDTNTQKEDATCYSGRNFGT